MPWLLNLTYVVVLLAVSPVLLYRRFVLGKYRDGWAQKLFGRLPQRSSSQPCLWFHAVSVGEVLQLRPLLRQLATRQPEWDFVVTTTTRTGLDVARKEFPQHQVCYFPLDFSWAVRRAIERVRPSAIVLVELELWPNFVLAADRLRIPLALINGRISERSFRGYRRIRPLLTNLLERFSLLAVQNAEYAQRFLTLGAPRARLHVTGSIKFDGAQANRSNPQTHELRQFFGLQAHERVFIAGSTQAPEESFALDTWQELLAEFSELRLILVPRHKERFEEVAQLVTSRGLPLRRRSQVTSLPNAAEPQRSHHAPRDEPNADSTPSAHSARHAERDGDKFGATESSMTRPVLLLDTLGELGACWGLADVAFVGGSLTRRGGQNMLEPAAYGAAVLVGPNTWNFRDIVEQLLARQASRVVRSAAELTFAVRELLRDRGAARELGSRARAFVATQQGATSLTIELLLPLPLKMTGTVTKAKRSSQAA